MLRSFFPLSIGAYTAVFIMTVFLFLGGMSWYALIQVDSLKQETRQRHRLMAKDEIANAIRRIEISAIDLGQRFASWDETLQQLSNPEYYTHWRENRVMSSGLVTKYFDQLELYDRDGNILSPSYDKDMPRNSSELDQLVLIKQHGHDHLYSKSVIYNDSSKKHITGYLVIKLDLLEALEEFQTFRYSNIDSLHINAGEGEKINVKDIIEHIEFDIVEQPEFDSLQSLLVRTLNNFALLGFILLLAAAYITHLVIGNPLRRISEHIDTLRTGDADSSIEGSPWYYAVAEIEKVRHSLSEYEYQLEAGAQALRESEAQKHTILENVVDAILTINRAGEIISFNSSAERIFGYSTLEVAGKHITFLMERSVRNNYKQYCEQTLGQIDAGQDEHRPCELTGVRKNGDEFDMELVVSPMKFAGNEYFVVVARDISIRKKTEERLVYLANYDTLTGLPNRILFKDRLEHAMAHASRNERMVGLLFFDLDRFKAVNDTFGHQNGDKLLKMVARRLQRNARASDTVARLGGDEFTVIVEDMLNVEEIAVVARKICTLLEEPFEINGQQVYISTSIGITVYPMDDSDAEALLKNADTAMYHAKEHGGSNYQYFTPDMNKRAMEWLALENNLRSAVENHQFRIFYQPRIDINTNRIIAVEALLRLKLPDGGYLSPSKFIPVLEETGLIDTLGEWVLDNACRQVVEWKHQGLADLRVAINLSPKQFKNSALVKTISTVVEKNQLSAEMLELEITENLLLENFDAVTDTLSRLSSLGINIAIDDFGTGYSSLNYLKQLPINTLKIDRSFVVDVIQDSNAAAIATAIVALARSLGMRITAEGVESEKQLKYLRQLGCHEVQGFFISEPLSADNFRAWLIEYGMIIQNPGESASH